MDKFPACIDQNIGMNFGKYTHIRFSFIPFTHAPYLSHILQLPVKDVKVHPLRLLEAQHATLVSQEKINNSL